MKLKPLIVLLAILITVSCQEKHNDYLLKIHTGDIDEVGAKTGYVDLRGDTIIPLGKYYYCYTDTLRTFAIVSTKGGELIGIDRQANKLFEVFWFDNGPDYVADGLFRIQKNGKIGYANLKGEIVITPRYTCAFPFENGRARVANECITIPEGEHSVWQSQEWMYIDTKGNKVEE